MRDDWRRQDLPHQWRNVVAARQSRQACNARRNATALDLCEPEVKWYRRRVMPDRLTEESRIARELAVVKLKEIELALRHADDIEAMEVVQHTIKELQGNLELRDRSKTLRRVAGDGLRQAASAVGETFQAAAEFTATTVRAKADRAAEDLANAKAVAADKASDLFRSDASGFAAGFSVAHEALAGFSEHLDWSTIDPSRYLYAGTRGVSRGMEEARLVWESIPEHLRALGPEEVSKRLDGFDWSHIVPHSQGGGNEASNGVFELASLNRSRGAEQMTEIEVQAAQQVLSEQAFQAALVETASRAFTGAVAGAAVGCVLACLEHGLEYQRGNITPDEMFQRIGRAVAKSAGVGAAVSGVMAIVALAFPALIPLAAPLMIPLAVLGFCAVGGKVVRLGKGWHELCRASTLVSVSAWFQSQSRRRQSRPVRNSQRASA